MTIKKIACCTDFSEHSKSAFVQALDLAEKYKAKLYVVHVLPPLINPMSIETDWVMPEEPKKTWILDIEERMRLEYGSKIKKSIDSELLVLDGHVSSEILNFIDKNGIDLIVMGSYGLSGMGLVFFGSVAKRVASKAECSVLIVRNKKDVQS
ncbi:MAG TPA: universal stress protein [Desulfobacteraceae bacterium]|nr:universal stress protein [Desulfobacteraceae bacterium]HPJ66203.1 universal stress protein [Desulfobacteraceae bacterium]HPQ29811.1 universal stress protein [Desulfobacteraceae bacterium]